MPASDDDHEREELGNALYMKVVDMAGKELAGKITGMMLESLEAPELRSVLDDTVVMKEKVEQAREVLVGDVSATGKRKESKDDDAIDTDVSKLEQKLAKLIKENKTLQDELLDAEKWSEDVLKEHEEKEAKWRKDTEALEAKFKSEKDALTKRATDAEERAKAAEAKPSNDSDNVDSLKAEVEAAAKCLKTAEAEKVTAETKATELQDCLKTAEAEKVTAETKAVEFEDKVKTLEASLAKASQQNEQRREEDSAADRTAQLEADKAAAEKAAKDSAARSEALAKKLAEVERIAASERDRADQATASNAKEESRKDRCRELQQELESVHKELKSYKAQVKALVADPKAPSKSAESKKLAEAQSEIAELRRKLRTANIPLESSTKIPKPPEKAKEHPQAPATAPPLLPTADPEVELEEDSQQVEEIIPDAKSKPRPVVSDSKIKAHPSAAGKPPKKRTSSTSLSQSVAPVQRKSLFQLSGTHVVAGCLALVVMIQLGLFVYEGWVGEQTWTP